MHAWKCSRNKWKPIETVQISFIELRDLKHQFEARKVEKKKEKKRNGYRVEYRRIGFQSLVFNAEFIQDTLWSINDFRMKALCFAFFPLWNGLDDN